MMLQARYLLVRQRARAGRERGRRRVGREHRRRDAAFDEDLLRVDVDRLIGGRAKRGRRARPGALGKTRELEVDHESIESNMDSHAIAFARKTPPYHHLLGLLLAHLLKFGLLQFELGLSIHFLSSLRSECFKSTTINEKKGILNSRSKQSFSLSRLEKSKYLFRFASDWGQEDSLIIWHQSMQASRHEQGGRLRSKSTPYMHTSTQHRHTLIHSRTGTMSDELQNAFD